jgi:hypothetical protein
MARDNWSCAHGSTCVTADDRPEFCNMFDCPQYQVRQDLKGNPSYDREAMREKSRRGKK